MWMNRCWHCVDVHQLVTCQAAPAHPWTMCWSLSAGHRTRTPAACPCPSQLSPALLSSTCDTGSWRSPPSGSCSASGLPLSSGTAWTHQSRSHTAACCCTGWSWPEGTATIQWFDIVLVSDGGGSAAVWRTHLGDRVIWAAGLHGGQDFLLFPKPEDQHPLRTACLPYEVLGIRGERHAHKLLNRHVPCSQNLPLPALLMLQVEHCYGGLLAALRHGQVTPVGTDGQSTHALALLWAWRDKQKHQY